MSEVCIDHINRVYNLCPFRLGEWVWVITCRKKAERHVRCGFVSGLYYQDGKVMVRVHRTGHGYYGEKVFKTREEASDALGKIEKDGGAE